MCRVLKYQLDSQSERICRSIKTTISFFRFSHSLKEFVMEDYKEKQNSEKEKTKKQISKNKNN